MELSVSIDGDSNEQGIEHHQRSTCNHPAEMTRMPCSVMLEKLPGSADYPLYRELLPSLSLRRHCSIMGEAIVTSDKESSSQLFFSAVLQGKMF